MDYELTYARKSVVERFGIQYATANGHTRIVDHWDDSDIRTSDYITDDIYVLVRAQAKGASE